VVSVEQLPDLLHKSGLSPRDQLLIVLAVDGTTKRVAEIKRLAVASGLRKASGWNVSQELSRTKGAAVLVTGGWKLSAAGKEQVARLVGAPEARLQNVSVSVRKHLGSITDLATRSFVEEAVGCFEAKHCRAAIVLSWVGAVNVLHKHVFDHKLKEFNAEATKLLATSRNPWKVATTQDDLGAMNEAMLLQVLVNIKVFSKNVKLLLEPQLHLRNGCGHPTSVQVDVNIAASHLETLMMNVYAKF
jgi:hypothetical protein